MQTKKGFTLVEVTVALALFGISVVVLTQSFLGGMFSLESFKFENSEYEALRFVYDKVISLEKRGEVESGGSIKTVDKGEVKWEGRVESTEVLELYKVILHASFVDEKFAVKTRNNTEEFYVYRPDWASSGERDMFLKGVKGDSDKDLGKDKNKEKSKEKGKGKEKKPS